MSTVELPSIAEIDRACEGADDEIVGRLIEAATHKRSSWWGESPDPSQAEVFVNLYELAHPERTVYLLHSAWGETSLDRHETLAEAESNYRELVELIDSEGKIHECESPYSCVDSFEDD